MDSEPVIPAKRVAHRVILLTTKERDFAQHVGLKKKIQSMRGSKKSEPPIVKPRQSGRDKSTAEKKAHYQLDQCPLGKIEE